MEKKRPFTANVTFENKLNNNETNPNFNNHGTGITTSFRL